MMSTEDQANLADNLFTDTMKGILDDDVIGNTLADIKSEQALANPTTSDERITDNKRLPTDKDIA
jgi:hypothetical protein